MTRLTKSQCARQAFLGSAIASSQEIRQSLAPTGLWLENSLNYQLLTTDYQLPTLYSYANNTQSHQIHWSEFVAQRLVVAYNVDDIRADTHDG